MLIKSSCYATIRSVFYSSKSILTWPIWLLLLLSVQPSLNSVRFRDQDLKVKCEIFEDFEEKTATVDILHCSIFPHSSVNCGGLHTQTWLPPHQPSLLVDLKMVSFTQKPNCGLSTKDLLLKWLCKVETKYELARRPVGRVRNPCHNYCTILKHFNVSMRSTSSFHWYKHNKFSKVLCNYCQNCATISTRTNVPRCLDLSRV